MLRATGHARMVTFASGAAQPGKVTCDQNLLSDVAAHCHIQLDLIQLDHIQLDLIKNGAAAGQTSSRLANQNMSRPLTRTRTPNATTYLTALRAADQAAFGTLVG